MHALVLASAADTATEDLARPIAGASLLFRQLEWLRRAGVTRVVVNRVAHRPLPPELSADAVAQAGVNVTWIPVDRPLSAQQLASRVGIPAGPTVVLEHAQIGNVSFTRAIDAARERGRAAIRVNDDVVRVVDFAAPSGEECSLEGDETAWLRRVDSELTAHRLTVDVLEHKVTEIAVRGTEVSPGIWRARGAMVVASAQLHAPCLLGPDTFVAAGATVGPGAILDDGAMVERGAHVLHARVQTNVVIGQGLRIERACAGPSGIMRHEGRAIPLLDPMLLGRRGGHGQVVSRAIAKLGSTVTRPFGALAPEAFGPLHRRLQRVATGDGEWLGVRNPEDPDGVTVDITQHLVPPDALDEERRMAAAIYQRTRSWRLDAKLLLVSVLGGVSSAPPPREDPSE